MESFEPVKFKSVHHPMKPMKLDEATSKSKIVDIHDKGWDTLSPLAVRKKYMEEFGEKDSKELKEELDKEMSLKNPEFVKILKAKGNGLGTAKRYWYKANRHTASGLMKMGMSEKHATKYAPAVIYTTMAVTAVGAGFGIYEAVANSRRHRAASC
jgi:hypothetical protein